jgi:hypothetical protein
LQRNIYRRRRFLCFGIVVRTVLYRPPRNLRTHGIVSVSLAFFCPQSPSCTIVTVSWLGLPFPFPGYLSPRAEYLVCVLLTEDGRGSRSLHGVSGGVGLEPSFARMRRVPRAVQLSRGLSDLYMDLA